MHVQLSDHFTYKKLARFTMPSIIMMIFTSIYGVVDGLFVSNIVGENALSAINIVWPLIVVIGAFGFMLGTGGSAEVAKTLGQGKKNQANRYFSMIIIAVASIAIILSAACILFIRPLSYLSGASDILIDDCVVYGTIILIGTPAYMLQTTFQTFFITAQKQKTGLLITVLSGVTNIILDFVFMYILKMGIAGAAIATVIGYIVGGIIPFVYFLLPNKSLLRIVKTKPYFKVLLHSAANGSSEMLSNISMSIVTFLYNIQMMRLMGESGVAAITVILYVHFICISSLLGFSVGVAPVIGFHYGAGNKDELKNLFKKCMKVVLGLSLFMTVFSELFALPLTAMFLSDNNELMNMTVYGFRLYATSFIFCGINIFASAFFTSLCNGLISAIISFLRSLVLQAAMIIILPMIFGINGIWLSLTAAEFITLFFSMFFLISQRKKYGYAE